MAKKAKKKSLREIEAMAIPSADNAKWIGIGFLTAVVITGIGVLVVTQLHLR